MGSGGIRRYGKFYSDQIKLSIEFIEKFLESQFSPDISFEKYLKVCEQLGQEPDPSRVPPSLSKVSEEVRAAFFVFEMLPDRWDGAAGVYLGKDISSLQSLYDIFGVSEKETVTVFLMHIQKTTSKLINKEVARKREAEKRSTNGIK